MQKPPAKTFYDLLVWQKSHRFVLDDYKYTERFPSHEIYGLSSQWRVAVSIPAKIAEGFKRQSKPDKARFLNISQGSLEESRYYFLLANDLSYGSSSQLMDLLEEVSKLLDAYLRSLHRSIAASRS